MAKSLIQEIDEYTARGIYPLHTPGHKRQTYGMPLLASELYRYDVTEIPGMDDLYATEEGGILYEAQRRAAELYGAKRTFFLVNGSTAGVLTAISAAVSRGGRLLVQRASHRSAYHAIELRGLHPHYLYGETTVEGLQRGVRLSEVTAAVEKHPEIEAVFLTSPTYEGYSTDIAAIASYLHERDIPLIVDAAHGAHFGMADFLPQSAVEAGADIVIMSLHKTLPSPTQTALLHIGNDGRLVDMERVERFFGIYQSSSPSYPLMAGIDYCIGRLAAWRDDGGEVWRQWYERRRVLSESLRDLRHIYIIDSFGEGSPRSLPEIGKLLICPRDGKSGYRIEERLRTEYKVQAELALPGYVLCICSVMDTEQGYERLAAALRAIDSDMSLWRENLKKTRRVEKPIMLKISCTIGEASELRSEYVNLLEAEGRVSGDYIYVYPPGQPIIVPGEVFSQPVIDRLRSIQRAGGQIRGLRADDTVSVAVL